MAVGRLTHLASTVTLASGSSASATIPNSGTVAVGDLLLAACAIPSGSRTMSISGGAGAWTSLGSAMQSGHTSQIWWRIAASGDLGATITVTPSTGAICQVLLLGSVAGVAPTTPVAAAFTTSVSATTKTTPALTAPSGSCEISAVWDSRGASTPQTAVWTAPTGETRQGQAFTIPQAGSSSGAWGDSDVTVSGTIGGRVWTADQAALGSSWTLAVSGAVTDQTISPGAISSTAAIYGPTAAPGAVTLAPAGIAPTTALYGPTANPGSVTLSPDPVASTVVAHSPSLDPGAVNVSPGRIESPAIAYEAELLPGPAALTPGLIGGTVILPAPELTPGPVVLAPQLVPPTAVVRQPALGSASAVMPERIGSGAVLYVPAASAGVVALTPEGIASAAVVYKSAASGSGQQVELNHVTTGTPRTRWSANGPRGWGEVGAPRSQWAAGAPST
ncbi:hypothetical protein [Streptomyces sp. PA03-2a]|uniref:hypothetical protein n=1 Tax=Streptomyces sp. PA03-2a TaxID=3028701 RepID=UPI0029A3336F|nr:hypothetical protein [Streptomyces sp. PA03-2a]MDX2732869.1 hypothetical protein [Streptomyces sp. PA03-2a]